MHKQSYYGQIGTYIRWDWRFFFTFSGVNVLVFYCRYKLQPVIAELYDIGLYVAYYHDCIDTLTILFDFLQVIYLNTEKYFLGLVTPDRNFVLTSTEILAW